ncbi:unnamed protein product [Protopolystoma xenopodis]|uniref:Uncharacterized protein n=1 Tax=Protopolystoma xenopodis TaxID=117903 RepID=A0A448WE83_9PLAT|nr:unnamed protein product [Protopolystoma xenopodis]
MDPHDTLRCLPASLSSYQFATHAHFDELPTFSGITGTRLSQGSMTTPIGTIPETGTDATAPACLSEGLETVCTPDLDFSIVMPAKTSQSPCSDLLGVDNAIPIETGSEIPCSSSNSPSGYLDILSYPAGTNNSTYQEASGNSTELLPSDDKLNKALYPISEGQSSMAEDNFESSIFPKIPDTAAVVSCSNQDFNIVSGRQQLQQGKTSPQLKLQKSSDLDSSTAISQSLDATEDQIDSLRIDEVPTSLFTK